MKVTHRNVTSWKFIIRVILFFCPYSRVTRVPVSRTCACSRNFNLIARINWIKLEAKPFEWVRRKVKTFNFTEKTNTARGKKRVFFFLSKCEGKKFLFHFQCCLWGSRRRGSSAGSSRKITTRWFKFWIWSCAKIELTCNLIFRGKFKFCPPENATGEI